MTDHNPFHDIGNRLGGQVDATAQEFAAAALGIPDGSRIVPLDVSQLALCLMIEPNGRATVSCRLAKHEAAELLRQLADSWDTESD